MKTRLKNGFLNIQYNNETYLCWFPYWFGISENNRKRLLDENKSLLIIEKRNGLTKLIDIPDNSLGESWCNNKKNRRCRKVIIETFKK